jgi:hypothetical protein
MLYGLSPSLEQHHKTENRNTIPTPYFIIKRKFCMLQKISKISNKSILANAFFLNFLMLHQKWRSAPRGFSEI